MATIQEIAEKADVSPATACRVLSGKKTKDANRRKVLEAARALNHPVPSSLAETEPAERPGKPNTPAVIMVPAINGNEGAYDAARELGYHILAFQSVEQNRDHILQLLSSGEAAGILLRGTDELRFAEECSKHYPTVTVHPYRNSHAVWINHDLARKQLLTELLAVGCQRIWCSSSSEPPKIDPNVLLQQVRDAGLPDEAIHFIDFQFHPTSERLDELLPFVEQILVLPPEQRPDGLLLPNSLIASGVVNLLRAYNIKVPDEIAIASAIGGKYDYACVPYLTSVLPPFYELSYEAMKMLDSLIHGRSCPLESRFSHKIHYGGSTRKELGFFGEKLE